MSQLTPSLHLSSSIFLPLTPGLTQVTIVVAPNNISVDNSPWPGGWRRCYHDIKSIETPQLTQHTLLLLIPSQLCANVGWGEDRRLTHWRPLAW